MAPALSSAWRTLVTPGLVTIMEADNPVQGRLCGSDAVICANLAVGGTWPGSPDKTTHFPAYYDIDYIRVYTEP